MFRRMFRRGIAAFWWGLILTTPSPLPAQIPAFPGAEGFGATTPGGRSGTVLIVDKLSDDESEGTLRWAVNQQFPRIIVFRVSGIIELTKPLEIGGPRNASFSGDNPYSYVTIAGQSAPGGGVILIHFPISLRNDVHDVVIRHLRVRNTRVDRQFGSIGDGIEFAGCYNVVVDHCSFSWFADEGVSLESEGSRMNHDATIQHCLIAEGLLNGGHPSGGPHSRAMIASDGTFNVSMHHNLMISCNKRNPSLAGNSELGSSEFPLTDVRYNLVYNFGEKGIQFARGALTNIVGNIVRFGPQTRAQKPMEAVDRQPAGTRVYLQDNCSIRRVGNADILDCPEDQTALVFGKNGIFAEFADSAFSAPAITPVEDLQAYLLENAGALPHDSADEKFINDYRNFSGNLGADSLSQDEITVVPPETGTPPPDTDRDGMPDDWETDNGLDPNEPNDANGDLDGDGYTNIEEYLNSLSPGLPTSVDERNGETPVTFQLFQNYPNPFNPETIIPYQLANHLHVRLVIYNLQGQRVRILVKGFRSVGTHNAIWDGKDELGRKVSSGVYFYRLEGAGVVLSRKMLLLQ